MSTTKTDDALETLFNGMINDICEKESVLTEETLLSLVLHEEKTATGRKWYFEKKKAQQITS